MALLALLLVTAIWGVTFVQVKDAVEIYPLFAFLAVRFAIASVALAPFTGGGRLRTLDRRGLVAGAGLGGLLALGYALQTAGLARTTVSSTGFITGLCVVLTPITAYVLFRDHIPAGAWVGVALATVGLAMLFGIAAGSAAGDLLVLGGAAAYALQIVLLERYAPHYDPVAFTLVEMVAACLGFTAVALARGQLSVPHGWTVWGALLVTGIFASASPCRSSSTASRRSPRALRHWRRWKSSTWQTVWIASPTSCRVASGSGLRSRGRSSAAAGYCSPTSRPARSTR
jgi:drug/metabolite transporter (DMT)-like permease